MESNFWLNMWSTRCIGFHQEEINPHLKSYWQHLNIEKGGTVFVPLCGKSQDMNWLVEQGYSVVGVELSEIAISEFFEESNLIPDIKNEDAFTSYTTEHIKIYKGDFFKLSSKQLEKCSAIYDRAALIALPDDMRINYCSHLKTILSDSTEILLVTLEYNEDELSGPPFSITANEVYRYFDRSASIEHLHNKPFRLKDIDAIEHVFKIDL